MARTGPEIPPPAIKALRVSVFGVKRVWCPRGSGEAFPPTIWSFHHGLARVSSTQASEMFQSSETSWSSKIMAEGTVERSHRR